MFIIARRFIKSVEVHKWNKTSIFYGLRLYFLQLWYRCKKYIDSLALLWRHVVITIVDKSIWCFSNLKFLVLLPNIPGVVVEIKFCSTGMLIISCLCFSSSYICATPPNFTYCILYHCKWKLNAKKMKITPTTNAFTRFSIFVSPFYARISDMQRGNDSV